MKKNRHFDTDFYKDAAYNDLYNFTETFYQWYSELATNKRAFAPLHYESQKDMSGWIEGYELDAKDDSYYLLQMIKESNIDTQKHNNTFRYFLDFAYKAINYYTQKILK